MALISRKDQRQLDRERQQIQRARRTQLEKAAPGMLKEIATLKSQKAALLAACKALMEEVEMKYLYQGDYGHFTEAHKLGRSAIEQAGESG